MENSTNWKLDNFFIILLIFLEPLSVTIATTFSFKDIFQDSARLFVDFRQYDAQPALLLRLPLTEEHHLKQPSLNITYLY